MQRRAAALYGLFFMLVVSGGYVVMAVNSGATVPASDSPEHTLNKGDEFTINGQQYTVSEISASKSDGGNIVRSASFQEMNNNTSVEFGDSETISMLIVRNGVPTSVSYTPSADTVTLGGEEYGAYYPNNNTVELMSSNVYSQELSTTESFSKRFRGLWATIVLGALAAILMICLSYLPRRG